MFRRRASFASLRNSSLGSLTDSAFMPESYFNLVQIAIRSCFSTNSARKTEEVPGVKGMHLFVMTGDTDW